MTRRSRRDAEKRITELEEAIAGGVEEMTTAELYIASLEAGMPGGPEWPEELVDRINAEYRRRIRRRGRGEGGEP